MIRATQCAKLILSLVLFFFVSDLLAQTELDERAMVDFRKGIGFNSPDGSFGLNMRTRMQNRLVFNLRDDFSIEDIEARVSRLRLRFDGYIKSKKLTYYLQLSFSRGDQDWDNTQVPNVVRDAMVYYHFNERFYIGFGQGKLPGNRQRIVSSGQQQFFDRSVVNANFTLDRDFGLFAYYSQDLAKMHIRLKGAISTGEGRNQLKTDQGLMYTARFELLPLGIFTGDGDFSEGDLEHEKTPKVALAAGYAFNHKARRSRGTTGLPLFESRDLKSFFADALVKYKGWALSTEFISRNVNKSPLTYKQTDSATMEYVMVGRGHNTQLSYCFHNFWEIAARYAVSTPEQEITDFARKDEYYLIGVNKYVKRHLTKFQLFTGYRMQSALSEAVTSKNNFIVVFQVELGI